MMIPTKLALHYPHPTPNQQRPSMTEELSLLCHASRRLIYSSDTVRENIYTTQYRIALRHRFIQPDSVLNSWHVTLPPRSLPPSDLFLGASTSHPQMQLLGAKYHIINQCFLAHRHVFDWQVVGGQDSRQEGLRIAFNRQELKGLEGKKRVPLFYT